MNLKNNTENQHFIPQVEQRHNTINPHADAKNQRIYSFSLKDRENYKISLDNKKGTKITNNLSDKHLFSFDVADQSSERFNFEALFHQYESEIRTNTTTLLSKLDSGHLDTQTEVRNIFNAKMMNFYRNPFSIEKALNTVGTLGSYSPTDPEIATMLNAVHLGTKPQQKYICSKYGISYPKYEEWLSNLFMLLHKLKDGLPNIMEMSNNTLFTDPSYFVSVIIYKYENEHCLLSDRGCSFPRHKDGPMALDFNLCSSAFISYTFLDFMTVAPKEVPKDMLERLCKDRPIIDVMYIKNDLDALRIYNNNVIYQCHSKVYGSADAYHGAQVLK